MMRFFLTVIVLLSTMGAVVLGSEFCSMCGTSGVEPLNSDLVIPFLAIDRNDNPTCQQVYEFALSEIPSTDEDCLIIQEHKGFCGCPGASTVPLDNCFLCTEVDDVPSNLGATTPYNDTCAELDNYMRFMSPDICASDRIQAMKRAAPFCGCPGVKADCYMCPDETNNMANPTRLIPMFEFLGDSSSATCEDLAAMYTLLDSTDVEFSSCQFMQDEAGYCGCDGADTAPVDACGLCASNSVLMSPNKMIADINMTCGELAAYLSYIPSTDCESGWVLNLQRFDFYCGCESATPAECSICPDGTTDVGRPNAVIPYLIIPNNENPTCSQLATLGAIANPGELILDDCSIFELNADFCGCAGASGPLNVCDFCPGGATPPNPNLITPFGDTCAELATYLSYLPEEECASERVGFIQRQDFLCGCPSATTACPLCAVDGSNDITFPNRSIPLLSLPLQTNPTCREVVEFMAINDGDLSTSGCKALQGYAGYCGCPSTRKVNACSFCPNGGAPSLPDKVVSEFFTCQGLYDFVAYLEADECDVDSDDFKKIQAFGYTCGCPDVEPACTLCPGGQNPSHMGKITPDGTTTCEEFMNLVVTLTADECAEAADTISATATTCGCPNGGGSNDGGGTSGNTSSSANKSNGSSNGGDNSQKAILISAIVVPLVLLILLVPYYVKTRHSRAQSADKMNAELEAQNELSDAVLLDGSYAMSDVNKSDIYPPPPSSVSPGGSSRVMSPGGSSRAMSAGSGSNRAMMSEDHFPISPGGSSRAMSEDVPVEDLDHEPKIV